MRYVCFFLDDEENLSQTTSNRSEESKLGFNMCECGFEGIAIKVAKRSSNQDECPHELASGILGMVSNKASIITIFGQKYFKLQFITYLKVGLYC